MLEIKEQVEQLLPPSGCAVIITSRNKFAVQGLEEKDLDVLPLEIAIQLLQEISGRIGSKAEELAKLCSCLPIALRNAAYALKERKDLGVAEYLKKLKDARNRVKLVEASFGLSYELLLLDMQRQWSMLSVFPADFDREGAGAIWEMASNSAAEGLSDLLKFSLLDYRETSARYRLHDLARDYTASRLETAVKARAQQRHAAYYQSVLWKANELFLKGGESLKAGLDLFDLE